MVRPRRLARSGALLWFARDDLIAAIRRARERVWLASPFLSHAVAAEIAEASAISGARQMRLLTALAESSVRTGVLDPGGLGVLADARFALASAPNLHAKVALVDEGWGLVGSGNLTSAGLGGGNVELGVVLSPAQRRSAARHFATWWRLAEPISPADLVPYTQIVRDRQHGAPGRSHGRPIKVPRGRDLDRRAAERRPERYARRYWLKSAYPAENGAPWWREQSWISDRRAAGYALGDLVVLYIGGRGAPRRCPAILEVTGETRHDPNWVRRHGRRDDSERWPFVTAVECVRVCPIERAPRPREFGVDPRSTQFGYRHLSAEAFRTASRLIHAS